MTDQDTVTGELLETEDNVMERILEDADAHLAEDRYEQALELLQSALGRPGFDIRVYEKAAFTLRMMGRHDGAELFEQIVINQEDGEAYFKLGHELVQGGLTRAALGPLHKCVTLAPEVAAVNYEFAFALMKEFFNEEALYYFHQATQNENIPAAQFFMGQLLLFLNRSDEAFTFVHGLEQLAKEDEDVTMQANYLKGMYRRYRTFRPEDIRDWQFVQYGTLLMRMFQEDYPDLGENPSNGRYTVVNFTEKMIIHVMAAFQTTIGPLTVFPEYSYVAAAGAVSLPLAYLFGEMLQLPVKTVEEGSASGQKGIVICSGSDELDEIAANVWDRGEILLFSFWHAWTRESNVLPDAIGYLAQAARFPWQERFERSENGEIVELPADPRSPQEIAADMQKKMVYVDMQWVGQIHDYYKAREEHLLVGDQTDIPRKKFFAHAAFGGDRF